MKAHFREHWYFEFALLSSYTHFHMCNGYLQIWKCSCYLWLDAKSHGISFTRKQIGDDISQHWGFCGICPAESLCQTNTARVNIVISNESSVHSCSAKRDAILRNLYKQFLNNPWGNCLFIFNLRFLFIYLPIPPSICSLLLLCF